MSLYPSLEDMKVDQMVKAQDAFFRGQQEEQRQSEDQASVIVSLSNEQSQLPYPINPGSAPVYPGLGEYMGLELTEEMIRANMPEYLQNEHGSSTVATVQSCANDVAISLSGLRSVSDYYVLLTDSTSSSVSMCLPLRSGARTQERQTRASRSLHNLDDVENTDDEDDHGFGVYSQLTPAGTANSGMVAPLSANSPGLAKSQVSHGVRQVVLCKDADGKVGLRVKAINKGIFVCLVAKNSPAAMGGLRFGDQILQLNGETLAGYSESKVHDKFKKASVNNIILAVRDRPFERTLTLHKDSTGHLGFQFKDGKITAIAVNSSAARNGMLIDHNLLEVNGQNVVGVKDKEVSKIIDEAGQIVTVTVIPKFIYNHMIKNISGSMMKKMMDHSIPDL